MGLQSLEAVTHSALCPCWAGDRTGTLLSVKGEQQSVIADKLELGAHTDKHMQIYRWEISKQALRDA